MVKTKKSPTSADTSKPDFVRSLPRSMLAAEIVEKARNAGIELTADRVHKIRFADKTKRAKARPAKPASGPPKQPESAKALQRPAAHGNKSAFVRSMPPEMSAKNVIAKGKAEGISLSIGQVYNIRAVAKAREKSSNAPKDARTVKSTAQLQLIRSKATGADGDGNEVRLRKLIAEVGLARSREVIAEVAAAFAG